MKRFITAKTVNRAAIFFLLAASITYHLFQVINIKDGSIFSAGVDFSQKSIQSAVLPSNANPIFILAK
ncbi:MAG TPA: hypothetical protein VGB71_05235 [Flavisolibacter sp.]|jgi:hypothetical protein